MLYVDYSGLTEVGPWNNVGFDFYLVCMYILIMYTYSLNLRDIRIG